MNKNKKKRIKTIKVSSLLLLIAALAIIFNLAISAIHTGLEIKQKNEKLNQLKVTLEQTLQEQQMLENTINGDKKQYYESIAHSLGYIYPNERIFYALR